ncbi:MAG: hypothetical protein M9927_18355 [Anaerolineae bacterium]|nr:hypothetical protein [Anaerolineae bacterium]
MDEFHYEVVGNLLIGTEKLMEDGILYRQAMPNEMRMIMVKEGGILLETLPDGRLRYTKTNIYGRTVKTLETYWKKVEGDGT